MSTVVECKFAEQTLPAGSSKVTQTGDASCTWSGLPEWDGSWWATLSVLHDRSHGLWVLHRTWLVKGSLAWRMSSNQDCGDVKRFLLSITPSAPSHIVASVISEREGVPQAVTKWGRGILAGVLSFPPLCGQRRW
jgi:hypothetical protein